MKINYSYPICAAAYLICVNNVLKEPVPSWELDAGRIGDLAEIYSLYSKMNKIPEDKQLSHPLQRNQAIRDSIANTKIGKQLFEMDGYLNYPGIINTPCRIFKLKEEYRNLGLTSIILDSLSQDIRYCILTYEIMR